MQVEGIDLLEISGGTYEQPKLLGVAGIEEEAPQQIAQSTRKREAYFVDFALAMREEVSLPLMVTGGFRLREAMERAVAGGGADPGGGAADRPRHSAIEHTEFAVGTASDSNMLVPGGQQETA